MPVSDPVLLVNDQDEPVGVGDKVQVHRDGTLHRAFSVFVFDSEGRLLLQQRHPDKYHSGGLWSNTCCSHPRPGEPVEAAAHRRLQEEMGFDCPVRPLFGFVYKIQLGDALYEHEYDHVLIGHYDGEPVPHPTEVAAWKWVSPAALQADIAAHPEAYTYWFRLVIDRVLAHVAAHPLLNSN